ncbi:MAG: DinB family protein [bacterium]|nr:DinB family protein [bacterium]
MVSQNSDQELRKYLVWNLQSGNAHVTFEAVVEGLPAELRGRKPTGAEHTLWEVLEHLRICQWDILEFSRNPDHVSPEWPAGYWPATAAPPTTEAWDESVARFLKDRSEMAALVEDPAADLYERFPHGDGQTLLREVLLLADHNAYHLGEMLLVRRLLGAWPT